MSGFRVVPLTLGRANELVERLHRHHGTLTFHLASIGAERTADQRAVGAATLQRPCSPVQDDRVTIEVARLVTDGTPNACSFLLGASARLAWCLGYLRIQTYTMAAESGASLRAVGWRMKRLEAVKGWNNPGRPRNDSHVLGPRIRWTALAPDVLSRSGGDDTELAFILGEAAGYSGAAKTNNPFCSNEECGQWYAWREGWEWAEFATMNAR